MFFNTQDKYFWENSQTTNLQDKTNMKPIAERKTVPNLDYFEDNPFLLHTKETFNLLLQDEYHELFQITEEIKNTKEELQQKGSKLGRSPIMNKKIKSILKEQFQMVLQRWIFWRIRLYILVFPFCGSLLFAFLNRIL